MEKYLLLGLILAALALFASERVRSDIVALGLLLAMLLTGILGVEEGFTGFASPAVITVVCMFVLSGALVRTGVADQLAALVLASGVRGQLGLTAIIMLMVGAMSAFMNNIAAAAILMPSVFAIAQRASVPVTKLLMPLSFGSLLGGLTTLVGTPPNLLASEALSQAGEQPFAMFDFAPTGLAVMAIGLAYMLLAGSRLTPVRTPQAMPDEATLRRYVTEVNVPKGSSLVGRSMAQAKLRATLGLAVLRVHRQYNAEREETPFGKPWISYGRHGRDEGNGWYSFVPWPETVFAANDHIQLEGDPSALLKRQGARYLEIMDSAHGNGDAEGRGLYIGEVALAPGSLAIGTTLEESAFSQRYGVTVLGLRRNGRHQVDRLNALRLEPGDVLLVRGSPEALAELAHNADFLVVNRLEHADRDHARRLIAVAIMATTIGLAAFGVLHISVAALLGMLAMVATGCMPVRDLYRHVDWRVIFMIAAMMPLSLAMDEQHTGAGRWIADGLLGLVGQGNPYLALGIIMLLTVSLTQVMSNAACVVLIAPIAIATAVGMAAAPQPFVMGVAIAASTSFLTPIGHQANLLVYGVGNYRFGDFVRVGGPMSALIVLASLWIVPAVWPFYP